VRRQVVVTDLRLRLWVVDAAIEWALWARASLPWPAVVMGGGGEGGVGGERMVEKQLHVNEEVEEEGKEVGEGKGKVADV